MIVASVVMVGSELGQGRGAYRDRRQRRRAAKAQRDLEQILARRPPGRSRTRPIGPRAAPSPAFEAEISARR